MNASQPDGRRRRLSVVTAAALVTSGLVALVGQAGPAAAASADGLVYSCSYGSLGTNLPTAMSIDTDLPPTSGVLAPLNIATTVTLTMPQAVFAQLQALPGFTSAKLTPSGTGDGVAETYIAPRGDPTPVTAHPVLSQQPAESSGDVPFSGSSPAPYAMSPGPSIPGPYAITAGAMSFQLVVTATTATSFQVTCVPSTASVPVDSFVVTAPTATSLQPVASWTYGDAPSGATATVTSSTSSTSWPAVTGAVQFFVDGVPAGEPAPLGSDGTATLSRLPATEPAGDHAVTAAYLPDPTSPYLASTSNPSSVRVVVGTATSVTIVPASALEIGDGASAVAKVSTTDGSTASGEVTFVVDGAALAPVPLSDGSATVALPTDMAGHRSVVASFAGTGLYLGSRSAVASVDIGSHTTTTTLTLDHTTASYGDAVLATATVASSRGTPSGSVTFTVDGRTVSATVGDDGVARATLPGLDQGDYEVTATFLPTSSAVFRGSSAAPVHLAIVRAVTTTTLRIDRSSVRYGETATATARVSSRQQTPIGTVVFTVGHRTFTVSLARGAARVVLPKLAPGTYAVTADFLPATGDFARSTSGPVGYTILRGSSWIAQHIDRPHHGKQLRCRLVVRASRGMVATGKVRVVLTSHGGKARARVMSLHAGGASVRFARPRPGRWSLVTTYLGSRTIAGSVRVKHGRSGH